MFLFLFKRSLYHCKEAGEIELEVLNALLEDIKTIELGAAFRGQDGGIRGEDTLREVTGGLGGVIALYDFRVGEAAPEEHLALLECLIVGSDGLDILTFRFGHREQTVDDRNLEEVFNIEEMLAHGIDALDDDAAVGILDREDTHIDPAVVERGEDVRGGDEIFELVVFDIIFSAIFFRGRFREAAKGAGNAD